MVPPPQEQARRPDPRPPLRVNIGLVRTVFLLALLVGVVALLGALQSILTQLLVALGVAYILDPVVDRIERIVRSRALAVALFLVPLVAVVVVVFIWLIPRLVDEIGTFIAKLPAMFQVGFDWTVGVLTERFKLELPHSIEEVMARFGSEIKDAAPGVIAAAQTALGGLLTGGAGVFRVASALILVPVFSVYLLYDFDRIVAFLGELVPRRHYRVVRDHALLIDRAVASFFRGQLTVCLVLGSLYSLGYTAIGLNMALLLGLGTGILAIVPYAGAVSGFLLALLSALLWFDSWLQVLGVGIVFLVVQTLDAVLITPRVLGKSVNLSPVLVIIALMVGGKLLGLAGVLIAVPVAASLRVLGQSFIRWYKTSEYYLQGGEGPASEETGQTAVPAAAPGEGEAPPGEADAADDASAAAPAPSPETESAPDAAESPTAVAVAEEAPAEEGTASEEPREPSAG